MLARQSRRPISGVGRPGGHRTLVVAAPGWGKTTALEAAASEPALCTTAAGLLRDGIPTPKTRLPAVLTVDDLADLTVSEQADVCRALADAPTSWSIVLASRAHLEPGVRRLVRGVVHEWGPRDLALDESMVREVLVSYGVTEAEAPGLVLAASAGWAMLVHFAADLLARDPRSDLARLAGRGRAAHGWLRREVLEGLPPGVEQSVAELAAFEPVTPDLVEMLHAQGHLSATPEAFELADALGFLAPHPRWGILDSTRLRVVPALAAVLDSAPVLGPVARDAAAHYARDGLPFAAAAILARAGDVAAARQLVRERGSEMLSQGDAVGVVDLIDQLADGPPGHDVDLTLLLADAHRMTGDGLSAERVLRSLARDHDGSTEPWSRRAAPVASWRLASLCFMNGDYRGALAALDHGDALGRPQVEAAPREREAMASADVDEVDALSLRAHVLSMLGRDDEAQRAAGRAMSAAAGSVDPRALAVAHLAVAKVSSGTAKMANLDRAHQTAVRAGDLMNACRALLNQSFVHLASARYAEAEVAARAAVAIGSVCSSPGRHSAALHNLAEALAALGHHEEALWTIDRSLAICRRLGPARAATGLWGRAEIHRSLGRVEQSRAAYAECLALAREADDRQVLVPALAGLARLLVDQHDDPRNVDPGGAYALALEAVSLASPTTAAPAHTAMAWVLVAVGASDSAVGHATLAISAARACHSLDHLAEALDVFAEASADLAAGRAALTEAREIWREGGARVAEWRLDVRLGRLPSAGSSDRSRARDAARSLQRLGIASVAGRALADLSPSRPIDIRVLGGFDVQVEGRAVPVTAWRSRQARTLVKLLAAREGRPVTRAALCEVLWPDDDPARTGHRLSVLLAAVRSVLDPERAWPPDHYINADLTGMRLDLRHVSVDADAVRSDAAHAADLLAEGDAARAMEILMDVDQRYRGDAFEDDPEQDWADGIREQTRAAWLSALRHLAMLLAREGRTHEAGALYVRLLAADPYDERVHRALVGSLVRAGRHGEARRAFVRWGRAMAEIGAPLPSTTLLQPPAGGSERHRTPARSVMTS